MDRENIFLCKEFNMRVIGKMICKMVKEQNYELMGQNMKDYIFKAKNMVKVYIFGLMDQNTMDNGNKTSKNI